ncbi:rhamnogalacturonidase [Polymorphobacter fuscus]|uniref:Glycoside hydrolase family 28 protein n=1 Tax=Sandarakinorhabdus fusca TaxID=1439888 RepID=A0A7C9GRD4_9SPHN|nr:glycoside hydrolase family 28 protein [Polymorphobacter fuscus]KAB7644092.1 glycoside hydrolase family 28 protein [Polymorphobacter fuscus]MQT18473.1 glycoside hydrolase family 28 protein [Polymorphobacter fuscus]NJC08406.1 polygalacturonase [Polymorphobacter fuscus]
MLDRRSLLVGAGFAAASIGRPAFAVTPGGAGWLNVRDFGAKGDGHTLDTPAVNRAIEHAAARGGGTIHFPPGTYACHSIHLRSKIELHLDIAATILAAPAPADGRGGYDLAEPQDPAIEPFQDFGHNHWQNSLIWGDGLHDIAITGSGLIWGKGLGRGDGKDAWLKDPNGPGTGNKAIALKNCRNVLLRDFKVLEGGWFALLATGTDNITIDNLLVDTNRDGFDFDCCRNVRITNCAVNSPWDDAICPKSSYALGYPRATENLMISNCFVTGNYQLGTLLDGTRKKMPDSFAPSVHGRIKFGTESNGGFKNITITNCVFEDSQGLALETVDGADFEDITISNIAMRGNFSSPFFLRLGRRMRGPAGARIGTMKRVLITNVTSSDAAQLPSIIAGLPGHPVEDVNISDVFLHQRGGAPAAWASLQPPLNELAYPEPSMFGDLPATGFFIRDARGVSISNVEIAVARTDPRPALYLKDVAAIDIARLRTPPGTVFALENVRDLRSSGHRTIKDLDLAMVGSQRL